MQSHQFLGGISVQPLRIVAGHVLFFVSCRSDEVEKKKKKAECWGVQQLNTLPALFKWTQDIKHVANPLSAYKKERQAT